VDARARRLTGYDEALEGTAMRFSLDMLGPLRPGALAALIFASSAAAVAPIARADQFLPAGGAWRIYVNDRYGTRIEFPTDIFTPGAPSENGDGQRFAAATAALEVFAWQNIDGDTPSTLRQRLLGAEGYTAVTYSPAGIDWVVLSGYRGDRIFYEKYLVGAELIHAFGVEYPNAERGDFAPLVERMEDSFTGG
jgi:hypothetical protein